MTPRHPWATVLVALGLAAAGCQADGAAGSPDAGRDATTRRGLTAAALERELSSRFRLDDPDAEPLEFRCRGGLRARVGARQECRVSSGEERVGLRVRRTRVHPLELDAEPFLEPVVVAKEMFGSMNNQGTRPQEVSCTGDLVGVVGRTTECTVTLDGQEQPVLATVTEVRGLMIDFTFEGA